MAPAARSPTGTGTPGSPLAPRVLFPPPLWSVRYPPLAHQPHAPIYQVERTTRATSHCAHCKGRQHEVDPPYPNIPVGQLRVMVHERPIRRNAGWKKYFTTRPATSVTGRRSLTPPRPSLLWRTRWKVSSCLARTGPRWQRVCAASRLRLAASPRAPGFGARRDGCRLPLAVFGARFLPPGPEAWRPHGDGTPSPSRLQSRHGRSLGGSAGRGRRRTTRRWTDLPHLAPSPDLSLMGSLPRYTPSPPPNWSTQAGSVFSLRLDSCIGFGRSRLNQITPEPRNHPPWRDSGWNPGGGLGLG